MNKKMKDFFPIAEIATGGGLLKLDRPSYKRQKTLKNKYTFTSGGIK